MEQFLRERRSREQWKSWTDDGKNPDWENYDTNLLCLQDLMDRLLGDMKGHNASFRPEITDGNKTFNHGKLCGFVEKLLSLWAQKKRDSTFMDPDTGESLAEPYIGARRELYGSYLYLVMRCSLLEGIYAAARGGETKERTDYAFLLEKARQVLRGWCVMENPDGSRKNNLFFGYDNQFGFHLYSVLNGSGEPLLLEKDWPLNHPAYLTDEGSIKRISFKDIYVGGMTGWEKRDGRPDGEEDGKEAGSHGMKDSGAKEDGGCDAGEEDEIRDDYDDYDFRDDSEEDDGFWGAGWEDEPWEETEDVERAFALAEEKDIKRQMIEDLQDSFGHPEEYLEACKLFKKKFEEAAPEVLRGFCEDLEEMVSLYLVDRNIPHLMDTDVVEEIYGSIYDGPYRRARRYARGVQWKNL